MEPFEPSKLKKLFKGYPPGSQDGRKNPLALAKVIARSSGTLTFYLVDYDPKEKEAKAYACGYEDSDGNGWECLDIAELAETGSCPCCNAGVSILLDSAFKPKPLSQCLEEPDDLI